MDNIIQAKNLSKRFGAKRAVDRLDLAVPKGAIFAFLGDNGAGKTTTLRMLMGLLPADSGSAQILGEDCWKAAVPLRRRVAYVPERPRFYDWMTVAEIGWFSAGFYDDAYLPRFNEWAERFLLNPRTRLSTLSKGSYAKVGLALALAVNPEVLVLDEPTSGLDLLVRREFLQSMVGLAAEGRTIIISSHQIAEVERVASHVAFLSHGRMLQAAPLEDVRRRIVRLQLRWEAQAPDPASLGTVLQHTSSGQVWQTVLQDPRLDALDALRGTAGIRDVEVVTLSLEEIYCALLARKETTP